MENTEKAMAVLVSIMESETAEVKLRLQAAQAVLEYSRPKGKESLFDPEGIRLAAEENMRGRER